MYDPKILVIVLIFCNCSVWASKARMTALGQTRVSHHIEDQRNALYFPHKLNLFNDFVIMEWGDDLNNISDTDNSDSVTNFGEGGFSRKMGNFIYQVYLGNDDGNERSTNADVVSNTTNTYNFLTENNRIDFSIAGNAGFFWGLGGWWAKGSKEYNPSGSTITKAQAESLGVRLSFGKENWSVWVIGDLKDEAKGNITSTPDTDTVRDNYESDFGLSAGGSINFGLWTVFAEHVDSAYKVTDVSLSSGVGESETTTINAGIGYNRKLNEMATFFGDLKYVNIKNENTDVSDSISTIDDEWSVASTFAIEAYANSWLQLRGSVSQSLFKKETDKSDTTSSPKLVTTGSGATTVAAGATISFNKLKIDGTISTTTGSYALGSGTLADVAIHYWF